MMNHSVTIELALAVIILGKLPTNNFPLFPELKQNLAGHRFIDYRDVKHLYQIGKLYMIWIVIDREYSESS